MFWNFDILKRLEWCENELNYLKDLKEFKNENKKRKKKHKLKIPPTNKNDLWY